MYRAKFDDQNKLWSSCDAPSVFNPNISISYILLRSLKLNGSKIAQVKFNFVLPKSNEVPIKNLNYR